MLLERSIFPWERVSSRSTWTSSHDFAIAQHADCKQMNSLRALNWFYRKNQYHRKSSQKVLGKLFSIIFGSLRTRIWSDNLYLWDYPNTDKTISQHKTLTNSIGNSITTRKDYICIYIERERRKKERKSHRPPTALIDYFCSYVSQMVNWIDRKSFS